MKLTVEGGEVFRSKLKPFSYFEPRSTKEAIKLLKKFGARAKLFAGGTDVIVGMRKGKYNPEVLINVKKISSISFPPKLSGKFIIISPVMTLSAIAESSLILRRLPVLAKTALMMASRQVRNRATIGGNLCNAAPSADMAPPLIALGAKVSIYGGKREKETQLEDFFIGPGQTALGKNQIMTKVNVPVMQRNEKIIYKKHVIRTSMDIAIASAAILIKKKRKVIEKARIVLGAVAPTPLRLKEAEEILTGSRADEATIFKVAMLCADRCLPITDVRAGDEYRREMIKTILVRGLREIIS